MSKSTPLIPKNRTPFGAMLDPIVQILLLSKSVMERLRWRINMVFAKGHSPHHKDIGGAWHQKK